MSIPANWCVVQMDEIAEIVTGNTPPKTDASNYGDAYPWVKPPHLGCDAPITHTEESLSEIGARLARLLPAGAVLVSCIGILGKVGIAGVPLATNQQINSVVLDDRLVCSRYAFYYCQTLSEWLEEQASATTIPIVNKGKFSLAPFILAPVNEQIRIGEQLDALLSLRDAAVAALKRVQANLKRYRASVLKAACEGRLVPTEAELARKEGRPYEPASELLKRILQERRAKWGADQLACMLAAGKRPTDDAWKQKYKEPEPPDTSNLPTLPEGWTWTKVNLVGFVQLGRQRSPQHHSGKHMRPYLRVANVFEDRIDTSDVLRMNFTPEEFATFELRPGDVLLNEGQSLELVGRPALYRGEVEGACFQNTLVRFRAVQGVLAEYALLVFLSYLHNQRFQRIAKWTTNIAHLGADRFANLGFPLPPIAEQGRIVSEWQAISATLAQVRSEVDVNARRASRLRQSILKRAFEGKLVPQDPNDEPASVLLERIRSERAEQAHYNANQKTKQRRAGAGRA